MKIHAILGSICAMIAVILGAFAAHGLKAHLDAYQLGIFNTGVRYQFYHSIALFLCFFLGKEASTKRFQFAGWAFFIGIILFSGSLYLLATRKLLALDNWTFILGPATPIGGSFFIIGWGLILAGLLVKDENR